jgi:hypothetical protein
VSASLPDDSFAACTVTARVVTNLRGTLEVQEDFNTTVAADLK